MVGVRRMEFSWLPAPRYHQYVSNHFIYCIFLILTLSLYFLNYKHVCWLVSFQELFFPDQTENTQNFANLHLTARLCTSRNVLLFMAWRFLWFLWKLFTYSIFYLFMIYLLLLYYYLCSVCCFINQFLIFHRSAQWHINSCCQHLLQHISR